MPVIAKQIPSEGTLAEVLKNVRASCDRSQTIVAHSQSLKAHSAAVMDNSRTNLAESKQLASRARELLRQYCFSELLRKRAAD
jgi:hypothetical protein